MSAEIEGWQGLGGFFAERAHRLRQGVWPGGQEPSWDSRSSCNRRNANQFIRDQGVEKPAVEGSEDFFLQASSDAH